MTITLMEVWGRSLSPCFLRGEKNLNLNRNLYMVAQTQMQKIITPKQIQMMSLAHIRQNPATTYLYILYT